MKRKDRLTPTTTCSYHCNGLLRGQEWKLHGHKGRACWTEQSEKDFRERMTGSTNPSWKGGVMYRHKQGNYKGQILVKCPPSFLGMSRKNGYVLEHRLKMSQHLNRLLEKEEVVHHIDHDPHNNKIENLMLFKNNSEHKIYEAQEQRLKK
ncbi:MAG: HNH endonuclease [Candidatus Nitrosopelagicus sp.]|nr:HNH endonuclease [Candidatus Nitrosopelagicus sp.]